MIATVPDEGRSSFTPYASGGGYSMPSIGSTFRTPDVTTGDHSAPLTEYSMPTTSRPTFSVPTNSGAAGATPLPVAPVLMPAASGTPSYSAPADAPPAVVPSTATDYFHDVLDLIAAQLGTGQPSASQQFSATPVMLPSGGGYGGGGMSLGDDGSAAVGGAAGPKWGRIALLLSIVGGAAFYWFYWRKRHGAA